MEKLRVADLNLLIDYKYDTMKKQCPPYKADFEKPNLTINIPKEEIIRLQKENPLLSCDDVEYVYTGAAFYEALLHFNGFMLHSSGIVKDGRAYLFSADPGTGKSTHTSLWQKYFGEDEAKIINDDKPAIRLVDGELYVYGTHVCKNLGSLNAQGNRVYDGELILYRLSCVYLALAEFANMESDNAYVEKYINLVRNRAYKSEAGSHIYKASDFLTNELAILHEKDKEFVQEGQRWWDLCRMKNPKDGIPLVFCIEGDNDNKVAIHDQKTAAYKVLWPLDQNILDNDSALEQTPGYE